MTDLRDVKQTWENLARTDPLWAICTDDKRLGGKWDAAEFFATGEAEISKVLAHVAAIGLKPRWEGRALDFGCGVGRLTQALCRRFAGCIGVDISPTMIRLAQQYNRYGERCVYALNDAEDLGKYRGGEFAFIYSSIVLQHMAPKYMRGYLREFARVLELGGMLVCQIPDCEQKLARLRKRLKLRTRLKSLMGIKLPEPGPDIDMPRMEMNWLSEQQVRQALKAGGCCVVDVQLTDLYDAPKPSVSKQYCAVK